MAVTKGRVKTAAVALADVAHGRVTGVRLVAQVGGAEAGIVPRVGLLDAPDFEDGEASTGLFISVFPLKQAQLELRRRNSRLHEPGGKNNACLRLV